jgi:hypothetical protein
LTTGDPMANLATMKRLGWVVIVYGRQYIAKNKNFVRALGQAEVFPTKRKALEEAGRWPHARVERRYEDTWRTP